MRQTFFTPRVFPSPVAPTLWARLTWSRPLFVLLVLNLIWTASLFLAPFTIPPGAVAYQVGAANWLDHEALWETLPLYTRLVYSFGDIQCHQLYYRSLWLNGNQLPLDARMTSMYIFANFGLVAAAFATPASTTSQTILNALPEGLRRRLSGLQAERAAASIIVLGLLPIAVDGFTQLFTTYESNNVTRILTGVPGGFVGGLLVGAMLMSLRQLTVEIREMRARFARTSTDLR